jgi:hypothetical protein
VTLLKKVGREKIVQTVEKCVDNVIEIANSCSDPRVKLQANKYLIDQAIGSPSSSHKDDNEDDENKNVDTNQLKAELEDIKNLKVVK